MNISFLSKADTAPISLDPDPPASNYQLSYNNFKQLQGISTIQSARQEQLQQKIEELQKINQTLQRQRQKQQQLKNQALFLMHAQILRLREIINEYDGNLRRSQQQQRNLQNIYSIKLQQLKVSLTQQFQSQLAIDNENTMKKLQSIKNEYVNKITAIINEQRKKQQELLMKKDEIDNKATRINVYEIKHEENQRQIQNLKENINQLETELYDLKEELKEIIQKQNIQANQNEIHISNLNQIKEQDQKLIKQLQNQLLSMKQQIQEVDKIKIQLNKKIVAKDQQITELTDSILTLKANNQTKQEQFSSLKVEHQALKKQYQFKNRITQKGSFSKPQQLNSQVQFKSLTERIKQKDILIQQNQQLESREVQQLKRKLIENQSIIANLKANNEKLSIQAKRKSDEYREALLLIQRRFDSLNVEWEKQQSNLNNVNKLIENTYLSEIEQLKGKLQQQKTQFEQLQFMYTHHLQQCKKK